MHFQVVSLNFHVYWYTLCKTILISNHNFLLFKHFQIQCSAIFVARNAKFFFLWASILREKTKICAIIRKSHFAQNFPIPRFRNSSFAQFRN